METYTFKVTSSLHISDPLYTSQQDVDRGIFTMAINLPCKSGEWNCDLHFKDQGDFWGVRVHEMIAYHSEYKLRKDENWHCIGTIGVDGGMAGIFDAERLYEIDEEVFNEEIDKEYLDNGSIVLQDLGVICTSGFGDGVYEVSKQVENGLTCAVKIVFIVEDDCEPDSP
jgi:hypothetical protein